MSIRTYILIIVSLIAINCSGQDTIKLDDKIAYSAVEFNKLGGKGNPAKYGIEIIVFSIYHQLVQYCNYIDGLRNCEFQEEYNIVNDSSLVITSNKIDVEAKKWWFKRISDSLYYLTRQVDNTLEIVYTSNLIPFKPNTITTTDLSGKDTLWTSILENGNHVIEFHKTKLTGKLYEYYDIDTPPLKEDGDTINQITIQNIIACYSTPMMDINTVAVIVTKTGKIVNIEQALGAIPESCPYTMQMIIKKLLEHKKFLPARKNGVPVNVRWFIKVDNLSREKIHPILIDDKKNRKKYIKFKRKKERKENRYQQSSERT